MEDTLNIYGNKSYERDLMIVPDCIEKNENEIPVKQYYVARLRNRIIGITTSQALGKIQVTNQRVLFRATGRNRKGKNTLQQEFDINQISGFEARNEKKFSFGDLFGAIVIAAVGSGLMALTRPAPLWVHIVLCCLLGLASVWCVITRKKYPFLKVLVLGAWTENIIGLRFAAGNSFAKVVLTLLLIAEFVMWIILIKDSIIHDNVVIYVKTSSTQPALNIRRKSARGPLMDSFDHTGYNEILPECDFDIAVKELGAMINDIKSLGDFAVEKWSK